MRLVLLILRPETGYDRGILRGISAAAAAYGEWRLRTTPYQANAADAVRIWKPEGVIGRIAGFDLAETLRALSIPAVNVSNGSAVEGVPRVGVDDCAVGRLAAEHLLGRGFRNFGYYSIYPDALLTAQRLEGFSAAVVASGRDAPRTYEKAPEVHWSGVDEDLLRWAQSLDRPAGVLCANDQSGQQFCETCRVGGLRVPEDVAVLGVDNDELVCEITRPSLSSVVVPARAIGAAATDLLARLLCGEPPPDEPIVIPPEPAVVRRSTDVRAIDNPDVAAAVEFIHAHTSEPITVADVLDAVPVARRALEQGFRRALGRSPLEEIHRARVRKARGLLRRTNLPLEQIAAACGLSNRQRLSVLFKKLTGHTPAAYRREFRS